MNSILELYYLEEIESGLRMFPQGIEASTPINSGPYVIPHETFVRDFSNSERRRQLITELDHLLYRMERAGITPLWILLGGSFVDRAKKDPKDIDGAIFYKAHAGQVKSGLANLQDSARRRRLDIRLLPFDATPALTAKMICYFSVLYSQRREEGPAKSSLIIDLAPPQLLELQLLGPTTP